MEMGEGAGVVGYISQRSSILLAIAPKISIMAAQCSTIEGRSLGKVVVQKLESDTGYSSGYSGYATTGYPTPYFHPPLSIHVHEEEDEYDRAAVGNENATERMYMRDVNDHGPYVNYHTIIEDSSEELHFARDPRADHLAASTRLEEDKEAGKGFQHESSPSDVALKPKIMESDVNLKPILKRKGDQIDVRPKKQVRAPKSENVEADGVTEPPKSVIFTPRKRAIGSVLTGNSLRHNDEDTLEDSSKESVHVAIRSVGIAAAEAQENEVCAMEEDSMEISVEKSVGSQKSFRQYRSRARPDDSAC
ncbi:hypothetical protein Taro_044009 [Colocasia esculenta]|uniref:U5 small nuclear ribonucleoprotein TSSC4 n=1 Tax=Colocasia esculenta TaxID=4460 RepID=A0A843WMK4_COLES|nr:hypothetical protein [Colocasia esculenta]